MGHVIGNDYIVDFEFRKVKMGKLLSNYVRAGLTSKVDDYVSSPVRKYYQVDYDTCYLDIKKITKIQEEEETLP